MMHSLKFPIPSLILTVPNSIRVVRIITDRRA